MNTGELLLRSQIIQAIQNRQYRLQVWQKARTLLQSACFRHIDGWVTYISIDTNVSINTK